MTKDPLRVFICTKEKGPEINTLTYEKFRSRAMVHWEYSNPDTGSDL